MTRQASARKVDGLWLISSAHANALLIAGLGLLTLQIPHFWRAVGEANLPPSTPRSLYWRLVVGAWRRSTLELMFRSIRAKRECPWKRFSCHERMDGWKLRVSVVDDGDDRAQFCSAG